MPKRYFFSLWLSAAEREQVNIMKASSVEGCETDAEFARLLFQREWNRRKGLPKPKAADWQTDFRIGRPLKKA